MTRVNGTPDPAAWAATAESLLPLGRRHLVAYSRWRQAEAELLLGAGTSDAQEPLREAYAIAVATGAAPLRRQVEALARRAKIVLTKTPADGGRREARFGLTEREVQVLRLLAAGKTNRQIGDELFITGKTASVHVSNVLAKLGASRRSEAAALAARMGLAGDGPPRLGPQS